MAAGEVIRKIPYRGRDSLLEVGIDFPGGSVCKESVCNAGDPGSIPGSGRSPGEVNGDLLQYYCLENHMDRGAWWATDHGTAESDMTEWLTHIISTFLKIILFNICSSVSKACLTLCNPMDCSTPDFPVLHYLLEFAQVLFNLTSVKSEFSLLKLVVSHHNGC